MSSQQKWLKIMSFILLIMCFVLAIVDSQVFAFANTTIGLLQAIVVCAAAVVDVALGVWGIGAANKPIRTQTLFLWATLAAVLNIVFVVVLVLLPGVWLANLINCVAVCLYWHFCRLVRNQSLD